MEGNNAKTKIIKFLFILIAIVYFVLPDPLPGPIDDLVVAVLMGVLQSRVGKKGSIEKNDKDMLE